MAKRISLKLSNENDWLLDSIEDERKIQKQRSKKIYTFICTFVQII